MRISLDTETTGLDLHHGAKPYLVTICDEDWTNTYWEWAVDPLTREPLVPDSDLEEIQSHLDSADLLVLQNPKFDVRALQTVFKGRLRWDWSKVRDTLLAGHLLRSNGRHDLDSMAVRYLGVSIERYDRELKRIVEECRRWARKNRPEWRIAQKGLPEMPSATATVWKYDGWLPRAVASEGEVETAKAHDYETVCSDYANGDSTTTMALWCVQEQLLKRDKLWDIYVERLKVLPVVHAMESRGVTLHRGRLQELVEDYRTKSEQLGKTCVGIARGYSRGDGNCYELELPKSGNNNSLREFCFTVAKLPVIATSKKTGEPSMDKTVLERWQESLPPKSKQLRFVECLAAKRQRDTALTYMDSYHRFWRCLDCPIPNRVCPEHCRFKESDYKVLHPSLNPTGTDTLRWSSQNPNEQNISKKEGFNLRYCFGPAQGREWWSLDAKNIELRIPAYEADEREMIELFEKPDDPPYYGSYHLLVFDTLHPEKFAEHGADCKNVYASTWYQWTKNGNFAVQYGAVESSGTADRAYHVVGAQRRIQSRFRRIKKLNQQMIGKAQRDGYVETIPDKTVDPYRGYPLYCSRTGGGKILPTVPLNYHVQGTAMWWMQKAMVRCHEFLEGTDGYMVMQVHDEIVFDLPVPTGKRTNWPLVRKLRRLMEQGGEDIGIPIAVSCSRHVNNWSE